MSDVLPFTTVDALPDRQVRLGILSTHAATGLPQMTHIMLDVNQALLLAAQINIAAWQAMYGHEKGKRDETARP